MTLELTIQSMFNKFPCLFKERSDCLDHLFCVIGNGFDWSGGELVYGYDDFRIDEEYLETCLVNGKAFQHNKLSLRAEARHYLEERREEDRVKGIKEDPNYEQVEDKYVNSLPDDVYHRRPRDKRWGFYLNGYCERYAYLFNYPENIRPDWLAGIEECKELLREDGYHPDNPKEHPIDTQANIEECQRYLKAGDW